MVDTIDLKSISLAEYKFKSCNKHNLGLLFNWLECAAHNCEVIGSSPIKPKNISGVIVLMVKILGCHSRRYRFESCLFRLKIYKQRCFLMIYMRYLFILFVQ